MGRVALLALLPVMVALGTAVLLTSSTAEEPVTLVNSRNGLAVLQVADISPGESRSSEVTLQNTGSQTGELTLALTDVTDTSPGGQLSSRLPGLTDARPPALAGHHRRARAAAQATPRRPPAGRLYTRHRTRPARRPRDAARTRTENPPRPRRRHSTDPHEALALLRRPLRRTLPHHRLRDRPRS
jgi:hypothetical protein